MISFKEQIELFEIIGKELNEETECFAVGGTAMMFYDLKDSTKDVDLVFTDRKSLNEVKFALDKSGFKEKTNVKIFRNYEVAETMPIMMEGKKTRFDLFYREIICFKLSETIIDRVKEVHEFGNLIVKIVSLEDIVLLKSATERKKDRDDASEIIRKANIKWDIIIKEAFHQTELNKPLFVVFLYDFLLELKEDFKAEIPDNILKELLKMSEKEMVKRLKKKI